MQKKINLSLFLALIVIFTLLLAACGGVGDGGAESTTAGEELFSQSTIGTTAGCKTCHSIEPDIVIVGPSLAGIGTRAASTVPDMTAEEYLKESILKPDAYVAEGFPAKVMPNVWAQQLTDAQVESLVEYMLTLK